MYLVFIVSPPRVVGKAAAARRETLRAPPKSTPIDKASGELPRRASLGSAERRLDDGNISVRRINADGKVTPCFIAFNLALAASSKFQLQLIDYLGL
ncbi:MAG TPA: hypothetical protein VHY32_01340 [Caulobacteraceae bacterium]|nr:hypothetical protein [Caulobacteraceae bacterium]